MDKEDTLNSAPIIPLSIKLPEKQFQSVGIPLSPAIVLKRPKKRGIAHEKNDFTDGSHCLDFRLLYNLSANQL